MKKYTFSFFDGSVIVIEDMILRWAIDKLGKMNFYMSDVVNIKIEEKHYESL